MTPDQLAELRGAIARGWCGPANERKVMDPDLAEAIAQEVAAFIAEASAAKDGEIDAAVDAAEANQAIWCEIAEERLARAQTAEAKAAALTKDLQKLVAASDEYEGDVARGNANNNRILEAIEAALATLTEQEPDREGDEGSVASRFPDTPTGSCVRDEGEG